MLQNKDSPRSQAAVCLSISRQFTNCICLFLFFKSFRFRESNFVPVLVKLAVLKQSFICTYKHMCTPGLLAHTTLIPVLSHTDTFMD